MIQQLLSMFGGGGATAVATPPKAPKPTTGEVGNADHPKEVKDSAKPEAKKNPLEQLKDNPSKLLASLNDQKMKDAITAFIDGKEANEKLVSEMITAAKAKLKETTDNLLKAEAPKAEAKSEVPDIKAEVKTEAKKDEPKADAAAPTDEPSAAETMQLLQMLASAAGK